MTPVFPQSCVTIFAHIVTFSDVYDGETKVCTIYWSCPWGSKSNDFQIRDRNEDYGVSVGDWNNDSGALGTVEVDITKKA